MNILEIANRWGEATKNGDWATLDALTSDNFQLIGPGPEPLSKEAYTTWAKNIFAACPGYDNNLRFTQSSGDTCEGTVLMEGRHTFDWDLSFMGLGVIPATGLEWKNPKENLMVVVRDGQVLRCEVEIPENGGVMGILTQLGVEVHQEDL